MGLISTKEAAEKLGVSTLRVQQLIWGGRLPAHKIGRDYVIQVSDLKLVADRKAGRPRKNPDEEIKSSTVATVKTRRNAKAK
jgi:excisionase family DNA binding protein